MRAARQAMIVEMVAEYNDLIVLVDRPSML